jgi:predicted metallopeptidase
VKLITANIPTHFVGLTKDAVSFFAKEYWSEKERNSVDEIKVVFLKFPRTSDVVAYTDHEIDPGYNPSLFIIEFNNTRYKDIKPNWYVRTIFHEMVHIGQIATGQLRTTSKAWYFNRRNIQTALHTGRCRGNSPHTGLRFARTSCSRNGSRSMS